MLKERHQLFAGLFIVADLAALTVAWLGAYALRFSVQLVPASKGVPPLANYLILLPLIFVVWGSVFRSAGLYAPMRGARSSHERRLVLRASSLAMLIFTAVNMAGIRWLARATSLITFVKLSVPVITPIALLVVGFNVARFSTP
ncbi:MAG: hypothetical protein ABGY42_08385, partial [bacterium]